MALAVTHFALGQALTALAVFALVPRTRFRGTLLVAGGCWALVPDVHWLPVVPREPTKTLLHDSVVANAFWFHGVLDAVDEHHSVGAAAVALGFLVVVLAVTELGPVLRARHRATTPARSR